MAQSTLCESYLIQLAMNTQVDSFVTWMVAEIKKGFMRNMEIKVLIKEIVLDCLN